MEQLNSPGDRIRDIRKRRGLTQRALADSSGVSLSLIKKLEQGDYGAVRLETLHKLAISLRVPTTALATQPDTQEPDREDIDQWLPVRRALEGTAAREPADEPTLAGLKMALATAVPLLVANRYTELRAILPDLLRDADALVASSVNGAASAARRLRSQIRQVTALLMSQSWQFDVAEHAIQMPIDDASDGLTEMSAIDQRCWALLRSGRLTESRDLAVRWSDYAEPRISRATKDELAAWGRFLLRVSTAAVRDNRPGEARDALKLARVAAVAAGSDMIVSCTPWDAFGPLTVSVIQAENAMIQDRPDITLAIAGQIEGKPFPVSRYYYRHRLDVANAHASTSQYGEAVAVLQAIRQAAPEWLAQQRYARDILYKIIVRRRTLTTEMRELADFVHLPL
jgi:transcriptional regulator with XRE-family HTH domain